MNKIDPVKIRKDFPMYNDHNDSYKHKPLVYLDNSATTFKPYSVIEAINHYYKDMTSNTRRGDYTLASDADIAFENARKTVADFINTNSENVIFTSGDTMSLNEIAYGLFDYISSGDEIVVSLEEHASSILPWFKIAKLKNAIIKYVQLDKDKKITISNFKEVISNKTKIVALASCSNTLGYPLPVKELAQIAHSVNAIYIDDAAQYVSHHKIDVKDTDVDFLAFSSHKIMGPTGVGVLYGKKEMLEKLSPLFYGGEMNARFYKDCSITLDELPYRLEAGTMNIAGVLGLDAAIKYINKIGYSAIYSHITQLKKYAEDKIKENKNIEIYNPDINSGILTFNVKDIFAQDVATYLSDKGIFVRSGQHCAKLMGEVFNTPSTLRASFYIYNTKDDVDYLVEALKHAEDFLDVFLY